MVQAKQTITKNTLIHSLITLNGYPTMLRLSVGRILCVATYVMSRRIILLPHVDRIHSFIQQSFLRTRVRNLSTNRRRVPMNVLLVVMMVMIIMIG